MAGQRDLSTVTSGILQALAPSCATRHVRWPRVTRWGFINHYGVGYGLGRSRAVLSLVMRLTSGAVITLADGEHVCACALTAATQAQVPVPANLVAVRLGQPVGGVHPRPLCLALVLTGSLAAALPRGPGAMLAAPLTRAAMAGSGAVDPGMLRVFLPERGRLLGLPREVGR